MRNSILIALFVSLTCRLSAADSAWPQFRGPHGNGVAAPCSVPVRFSEEENIAWKTTLPGKGWSSPVVADDKLWLTTAVETLPTEQERETLLERAGTDPKIYKIRHLAKSISLQLLCVDLASGELMTQRELIRIDEPEPIHTLNSYASPTPMIDGEQIYCHFGTFGTVCLDRRDLSVVWQRRLPLDHAVGPGSSPYVYQNLLVLICDGIDRQYVTALDKRTGNTLWSIDRPHMDAPDGDHKKAFVTPIAVTDRLGREQLICMGSQWLVAYDPTSGDEIWKVHHGRGFSVVPRPVIGHGMVYVSTGFGKPQLWAVRIDGTGDVTETHVAWTATRGIPAKPSPLLVGGELYVIDDMGIANCFDALDGNVRWTKRISGNYSASPLFADGKIFYCNQEGKITVVQAGSEYTELAENHLSGQIMASPIALDDALFIRTDTALYRIGGAVQRPGREVSRRR